MTASTASRLEPEDQRPEQGPTNWSSAYARFLSGSLVNAQKTLRLYQQTLEYVAAGRLPASVFQEYYPRFVQRHGALYAERLTRLGAGFMGRLAELNQRNAARAAGGVDDMAPPIFETSAPERWYEQYAEYAGRLNARALEAYRRQLDQVAAGELSADDMQQKMAGDMSRQVPYYTQDAGQLYLGLMHDLDELRGNYEEAYLRGILALADEPGREAVVTAISLQAPLGGAAFQSFTVTNTTGTKMPVEYTVTEVRRMDGVGAAFAPKVAINPETLELDPGEDATITFSVQLEADHYEVDTPYIGFLYVTGAGDRRVELQLRIVATAAGPEPET